MIDPECFERMQASKSRIETIDGYFAKFPKNIRDVLEGLRRAVRESAPGAEETISYGMPTFDLFGKHLVFFAAWKNHTGFYPVTSLMVEAFKKELTPFKRAKGSVQFPMDEPIPLDLVKKIVKFRIKEIESKKK